MFEEVWVREPTLAPPFVAASEIFLGHRRNMGVSRIFLVPLRSTLLVKEEVQVRLESTS